MKTSILIAIILAAVISCSTSNESGRKQTIQKWQLVKMSGSFAGSETVGNNMQWQETYILKSDRTFTKIRDEKGTVSEASGSYKFLELSDGKYLELTYKAVNNLIGNCTGDLKEILKVNSETKMRSTWLACDGPGLEYEIKR